MARSFHAANILTVAAPTTELNLLSYYYYCTRASNIILVLLTQLLIDGY